MALRFARLFGVLLAALGGRGATAGPIRPDPLPQVGHAGGPLAARFSPDGRLAVTAGGDGRALLWDAANGRLLRAFDAPGAHSVEFAPDGRSVLVNGALFEVETGRVRWRAADHTILGAKFSPDGRRLLTASAWAVTLWDADSGRPSRTLVTEASAEGVYRAAAVFSPDGLTVAVPTRSDNREAAAELFSAADGRRLRAIGPGDAPATDVSFSPDGRLLAGTSGSRLVLWDARTGRGIRTVREFAPDGPRETASFSPDGARLLTFGWDGSAALWDAATGRRVRDIPPPAGMSCNYARFVSDRVVLMGASRPNPPDPRGPHVLTATYRTTLWDVETGRPAGEIPEPTTLLTPDNTAVSPDRRRVLLGDRVVDAGTGRDVCRLGTPLAWCLAPAVSPDGRWLVAGAGFSADVWDVASGRLTRSVDGLTQFGPAAFVSDGRFAVVGRDEHTLRVFDAASGEMTAQSQGFPRGGGRGRLALHQTVAHDHQRVAVWDALAGRDVSAARVTHPNLASESCVWPSTLSPDGATLLVGTADGSALVRDAATGETLYSIPSLGPGRSPAVGFSPDGRYLAVADGRAVVLRDATSGRFLRTLGGHAGDVSAIAFDPASRRLAAGAGRTLVVWDVTTGERLHVLDDDPGHVHDLRFTDAGLIAGASHTGDLACWTLGPNPTRVVIRPGASWGTQWAVTAGGARVITAMADGTLRAWDAATGDELLRVYRFGADDWLAHTPEGLFDGTPAGRNLVSYRVGGGLTVVPVDRFFQDFYRPGLLAEVLRGGRPKPTADFAARTPPAVRLLLPAETDVQVFTVTVEAEDRGGGARDPWLKNNGKSVAPASHPLRRGGVVSRRFVVAPTEGENRLEGGSASGDGSWESEPAVAAVRFSGTLPKPRLFVVAVGVGDYADAGLRLRFPADDAKALAGLFRRRGPGLYEEVVAEVLTDAGAGRDAVRAAFGRVAARAGPQDALVVALSGHGALSGQRYYFLPGDYAQGERAADAAARESGLSDDELADLVRSVKASKRVLILDTCNAGGAAQLFALGEKSADTLGTVAERLMRNHGVALIAAAAAGDAAHEVRELGHGVLTYALLAAVGAVDRGPLRGDALKPATGGVAEVQEWFVHAEGRARALMRQYYQRDQNLKVRVPESGFPLVPAREPPPGPGAAR